ncbi:MAG: hypothetical protein Q8S73_20390 [Deltaproteobacteria bacterium]|nr:hypothetical protein [Deltaproteobacteria bacterium]
MSRLGAHRSFGTIFETTLLPLPKTRLLDRQRELCRLYDEHLGR